MYYLSLQWSSYCLHRSSDAGYASHVRESLLGIFIRLRFYVRWLDKTVDTVSKYTSVLSPKHIIFVAYFERIREDYWVGGSFFSSKHSQKSCSTGKRMGVKNPRNFLCKFSRSTLLFISISSRCQSLRYQNHLPIQIQLFFWFRRSIVGLMAYGGPRNGK